VGSVGNDWSRTGGVSGSWCTFVSFLCSKGQPKLRLLLGLKLHWPQGRQNDDDSGGQPLAPAS
jgi:hypothetical protein